MFLVCFIFILFEVVFVRVALRICLCSDVVVRYFVVCFCFAGVGIYMICLGWLVMLMLFRGGCLSEFGCYLTFV